MAERRKLPSWRALALAGAGSTALLTARILLSPRTALWRWLHPEFWSAAREGETWGEGIERRLGAVEEHLRHLPPERTDPDA